MSWLTLVLQALAAIPKVIGLLRDAFKAIRDIQERRQIDGAKEANNSGDTLETEKKLGSDNPGQPSGLDGSIVRRKSRDKR